jgi:Uma2 family endonuclease
MQEKIKNKRMTYEEFLNLCDEDTLAEWVDGEIIYYSPASSKHQELVWFLGSLLGIYAQAKDIGVIRTGPFQMRLRKLKRGREPDILFISKANLGKLNSIYLDGPADLVVEIISPESERKDREEKFSEYQQAGIKEYWLIDPYKKQADFYVLEKGTFNKKEPKKGIYYSRIVEGFWLDVNWLFKEPLPNVQRTIIKIGGKEYKKLLRNILEEE